MKKRNKKSGFTLVELMVVAAIIAILAAIIIPMLSKNKESAVAADGKNIAGAVLNAAKAQYARTGTWPTYATLDDAELTTEVNASHWTIALGASATANPQVTATIKAGGYQGYYGNVSLAAGTWTDALTTTAPE